MSVATIAFSKAEARAPSARTLRAVSTRMERDGAVAFEGLFPMPLLNGARREVLRRHASGELRARGLVRDIAGRYAAVLPFAGPFLEPAFYANPAVLAVVSALLGGDFCIGSLEAVVAEPGAGNQHQHIDGPMRFDRVVGRSRRPYRGDLSGLPPYAVSLGIPLCDVGEENGPTALWLGSHKAALRPRPPGEAAVGRDYPMARMTGAFGRSFLFDFRLFHGGLENLSREPRPLLTFVFTRRWYRDPNLAEVRPGVVISRRDLERVPERHRGLFALAPAARRALWEPRWRGA